MAPSTVSTVWSRNLERHVTQSVDIQAQIDTGALEITVTEYIPNRLDADAAPQQAHGECVAQGVRGVSSRVLTALLEALDEDLVDAGVLERTYGTAFPQEESRLLVGLVPSITVATEILA
jgi:hypothetical protein